MKKQANLLNNDLISIIIPVYNSGLFIAKCLNSLINQTYTNIEIICINDGSLDNSLDVLKKYQKKDKRVKIIDKENAGVSAARNDGLKFASGEYITFVDADDWLEENAIEILYNTLKREKVDVVRGNYYVNYSYDDNKFLDTGNLAELGNLKISTNDKNFDSLVIDRLLDGRLPCFIWLLLIKKSVLKDIFFKEDIKYMEDTIFYNELMNKINSIYFLDKPLYHYFNNLDSCTRSSEYYIRNMYNIIDVNKYLSNILINGRFYSENRLQILNTTHLNFIMNYFYFIYKMSSKNKKELIIEMNKILDNEDVQKLIQNVDLKKLPFHLRMSAELIIKKKYTKLFIFYRVRYFLSKIKNH